MSLEALYMALAGAFDGPLEIERTSRDALFGAASNARFDGKAYPLAKPFLDVMTKNNAHPVCKSILETTLPWAPPETSSDPAYIAHSIPKAHVELLGPDGLVKSDIVRIGLYGMLSDAEYGIRTHPAEEVFVMLAGETDWKRGDADYIPHGPGERSYHPSMMPHAQRTREKAFMSIYAWSGDVSAENYVYSGIPAG